MSTERPNLKDPAAILALPKFGAIPLHFVADANAEIHYRGRTMKCSEPGAKVTIPKMPSLKAVWFEDDDLMAVADQNGTLWRPVDTDEGWMRERIGF